MLCHPSTKDHRQVLETCERHQLDPIGADYLRYLESQWSPPLDFTPTDRRHWPSYSFIVEHGIHDLYFPTASVRTARRILQHAKVKEFVETMTMLAAPLHIMADELTLRKSFDCTEEDLRAYQRYYWDLSLVDSSELRAILQLRWTTTHHQGTKRRDSEGNEQHTPSDAEGHVPVMSKVMYGDPRHLASILPSSPYSALVAQMRMGLLPAQLDTKKTLETAEKMIAIRLLEAASGTGQYDSTKVAEWTSSVKNLRETISAMSSPEEALRAQIQTFALKTSEDTVPLMSEVSGGNHTTQLFPDSVLRGTEVDPEEPGRG